MSSIRLLHGRPIRRSKSAAGVPSPSGSSYRAADVFAAPDPGPVFLAPLVHRSILHLRLLFVYVEDDANIPLSRF